MGIACKALQQFYLQSLPLVAFQEAHGGHQERGGHLQLGAAGGLQLRHLHRVGVLGIHPSAAYLVVETALLGFGQKLVELLHYVGLVEAEGVAHVEGSVAAEGYLHTVASHVTCRHGYVVVHEGVGLAVLQGGYHVGHGGVAFQLDVLASRHINIVYRAGWHGYGLADDIGLAVDDYGLGA